MSMSNKFLAKPIKKIQQYGLSKIFYKAYKAIMYRYYMRMLKTLIETGTDVSTRLDSIFPHALACKDGNSPVRKVCAKVRIIVVNEEIGGESKSCVASITELTECSEEIEYELLEISSTDPLGSPRAVNRAIQAVDCENILLISNRYVITNPEWLREMILLLEAFQAGAIVVAESVSENSRGVAILSDEPICMMIKKQLFQALNGLNELFVSLDAVLDLCLRARSKGIPIKVTSKAIIRAINIQAPSTVNQMDRSLMVDRWGEHFK